MAEIIKSEKINNTFGIVLQYYPDGNREDKGYEIMISKIGYEGWFDSDGVYSRKVDAMKVYNAMKKEYKNKEKPMIEYRVSRKSSTQGMYFETDKGDDTAVGIGRIMWINSYGPSDDITIQEWKPRGKFLKQ
jgi:hypothetical protein